jgi:nitric oxide dioxygenase
MVDDLMAAMTEHQILLVQTSFTKLVDDIDDVARIFFEKLFELDPTLQPMFSSEMQVQGRKMFRTLLVIVNALNDPNSIVEMMRGLSKRHIGYGVKAEHYATVGDALVRTIHEALGDAASQEIDAAWMAAYTLVADIAKAAAYPQAVSETALS